jgi:hypothetical protein
MKLYVFYGTRIFIRAVFRKLFLPAAHPTLIMAHEFTPQNFTLRKGGTQQYVATKYAHPVCKSLSYID